MTIQALLFVTNSHHCPQQTKIRLIGLISIKEAQGVVAVA
jgi:hypothetical protein